MKISAGERREQGDEPKKSPRQLLEARYPPDKARRPDDERTDATVTCIWVFLTLNMSRSLWVIWCTFAKIGLQLNGSLWSETDENLDLDGVCNMHVGSFSVLFEKKKTGRDSKTCHHRVKQMKNAPRRCMLYAYKYF